MSVEWTYRERKLGEDRGGKDRMRWLGPIGFITLV